MKIVFLTNSLGYGGAERTISYLSKYFAENGDEAVIICMTNEIAYQIDDKVKLIRLNIPNSFDSFLGRAGNTVQRFVSINKAVYHEKPDAVICMMALHARFLVWHMTLPFKLLVSERSNPKFYNYKSLRTLRKIFQKSDGIVFQTERVKLLFDNITRDKAAVIPNAAGNEYAGRIRWNPDKSGMIIAIGRLVKEKDYETLIHAFAIFLESHSWYRLEIYGNGPEKEKLEKLIICKGLTGRVLLKDSRPDVLVCAAKADCYVLSSICEGMPNTLIEAMSIGMPCISSDCEFGPAELIKNGVSGLLVPVRDVQALSEAITKLVDDTKTAVQFGCEAGRIRETHSIEAVCKRYQEYLYSL